MNYSSGSILAVVFLFISFSLSAQVPDEYYSIARGKSGAELKIAVITDIHFLSPRLAGESEALYAFEKSTGRNVTDQHKVLDKMLGDLVKENPDILLVSGDITNHGERQSHLDFIEKLRPLQKRGTRIFVIPGNHDINIPDAKAYTDVKATPVENISKEEFAKLYRSFGYGDALKKDSASLSYLAAVDEDTWLLCFDSSRYDEYTTGSITGGRIRPQTMEWALSLLQKAKEKGIRVIGMMHHGLVEHMAYQSAFFPDYLVDDWEKNADILADAGLKVIFTGHFHSNDITLRTTPKGNTIYDIETSSLAQYPFAWRMMILDECNLSVDTRFVDKIPGHAAFEEESRQRLEMITRRVAKGKLIAMGMPLPATTMEAFTDVIVKLYMMHVRGDEKPDQEMERAIRMFASLLGDEAEIDEFTFDFPPGDINVVIPLKKGVM
ncbi:MAG: metallophosphoesterase [Proteiniphilum sp.]|nr:metallophosphoesterase [Proteiniphilum sp.]